MIAAFLLAFPALFSIVNPLGSAFIFREATAERTHEERVRLARRVGVYALLVMLVALWAGSYVLQFFGISMAALRIAGGMVLTGFAWELLGAPEKREDRKAKQATEGSSEDMAFFPLTLPFTTGPGTIAVSVALGANHPPGGPAWAFFVGASAAAAALAGIVAVVYGFADRLGELLGRSGSRTVGRLSAFILICIGVQMFLTGVEAFVRPLIER